MTSNKITDEGFKILFQYVKTNQNIHTLNLS